MPARDAMPARCASLAMAAAAASLSLLQPAFGQDESNAIPEELRIIQDFPAPAEDAGDVGQLQEPENDDGQSTDQRSLILDDDRGSLFDEDRSLLFNTRDTSPAQRLLPEDLDPDIETDPRATGEDSLDPRLRGPQPRVADPQDRIGADAGATGGGGSSGGSLF